MGRLVKALRGVFAVLCALCAATVPLRWESAAQVDAPPGAFDPEAALEGMAEADAPPLPSGRPGDSPLRIVAGPDWVPLEYAKNIVAGSALDFSAMPWFDAPAGRHGRVVARGGHFEFENLPGVPQRFWGVNLCQSANFPAHELADELAERLRRLGFNAVRLHHHDGMLADANGDAWDRFDYLVAALVKRGIYLETDLYVSRPVKWREIGIDRDGESERYARRALMTFYEPAFSNWCAFARSFLSHRNPYTGRRYAEEPAWIGIGLVNEGRFVFPYEELPQLEPFQRKWREWIAARRAADPGCYPELGPRPGRYPDVRWRDQKDMTLPQACCDFTADLERAFVARARAFLRDGLGCRAPLSNNNNSAPYAAMLRARAECHDFADVHAYRGGVAKGPAPVSTPIDNPFLPNEDGFSRNAWARTLGKPFVISEADFGKPNPLRAGGALKLGALAAIQDWSAVFQFAYSHKAATLAEGAFAKSAHDLVVDPLNLAAHRAALPIFLRGDLAPARETCALILDEASIHPGHGKGQHPHPRWGMGAAVYAMRCGTCLPDAVPPAARAFPLMNVVDAEAAPFEPSAAPPVAFDAQRGALAVATDRTAAAFATAGRVAAGPLEADLGADAAWISATALDDAPLAESGRILLSFLGDVQNEGATYADATRTAMTNSGNPARFLVRNQRAEISLALDCPQLASVHKSPLSTNDTDANTNDSGGASRPGEPEELSLKIDGNEDLRFVNNPFTVFALSTAGERLAEVPCEWLPARPEGSPHHSGVLRFTASTRQPFGGCMNYEIVRNRFDTHSASWYH